MAEDVLLEEALFLFVAPFRMLCGATVSSMMIKKRAMTQTSLHGFFKAIEFNPAWNQNLCH